MKNVRGVVSFAVFPFWFDVAAILMDGFYERFIESGIGFQRRVGHHGNKDIP